MTDSPLPVHDRESAVTFVEWCVNSLGLCYHPDTPFQDYLEQDGRTRCFADADAETLNRMQDDAFSHCDPYEEGLRLFKEIYGFPCP